MFAYLEGALIEKNPLLVVLDVGGIGYELVIPTSTYHGLGALGEKVRLLTHFHVREDVQMLYGFGTNEERALFRLLLGVSGIGPKMAVTVLSGLSAAELASAVEAGNSAPLSTISGVGKKTAERILLELKGKMPVGLTSAVQAQTAQRETKEDLSDALLALISLGYKKANAEKAVQKVLEKTPRLAVEELIREALKVI